MSSWIVHFVFKDGRKPGYPIDIFISRLYQDEHLSNRHLRPMFAVAPIVLPTQSYTQHTMAQHTKLQRSNAQRIKSKKTGTTQHTDTMVPPTHENPFADPEDRTRSPDDTVIECDITTEHKTCDCCKYTHPPSQAIFKLTTTATFCRHVAKVMHDGQFDLEAIEQLIERKAYKKGYANGRTRNDVEIEEALEEAYQIGWDEAMEHVLEIKKRVRTAAKEEDKCLERRDSVTEWMNLAECGLDEPSMVGEWARRAMAGVKAKMGRKGKDKAREAEMREKGYVRL